MAPHTAEIRMQAGEDFSANIEWVDNQGNPIVTGGDARMDVVGKNTGQVILRFDSGNTEGTEAHIAPLGVSGIVKMTCPAAVSATIVPGRYDFDLVVHVPDDDSPFPGNTQRRYILSGDFVVLKTRTSMA